MNKIKKIGVELIVVCMILVFIFPLFACGGNQKENDNDDIIKNINISYNEQKNRIGLSYYYTINLSITNNNDASIYNVYIYYEYEKLATGELFYAEKKIIGVNGLGAKETTQIVFNTDSIFDDVNYYSSIFVTRASFKYTKELF